MQREILPGVQRGPRRRRTGPLISQGTPTRCFDRWEPASWAKSIVEGAQRDSTRSRRGRPREPGTGVLAPGRCGYGVSRERSCESESASGPPPVEPPPIPSSRSAALSSGGTRRTVATLVQVKVEFEPGALYSDRASLGLSLPRPQATLPSCAGGTSTRSRSLALGSLAGLPEVSFRWSRGFHGDRGDQRVTGTPEATR